MKKIVFIGGTGRCGTNLMKEILSLHPKVATHPFEYKFIIDPDGIIDFYNAALHTWSPYVIDNKLHRLETFLKILAKKYDGKEIYTDWELSEHLPSYEKKVNKLLERLIDLKYKGIHHGLEYERDIYVMGYKPKPELSRILGSFIWDMLSDYLLERGKEVYVEDNTHNILFAREILELMPEAKFIHMIREPRDVIASLSKQRWTPKDKIQAAKWYQYVISRMRDVTKDIPQESIITLDLYDIVDTPERTLREICDFLGIPFSLNMLEIDLSESHMNRWKKDFTKEELNAIEAILEKDPTGMRL